LTVSQWRNQLQLKWNPGSDALREVGGAELLIADGPSRRRIELNAAALRGGNIVYAPHTDDVSFQLRTFGSRPQIASVRFLGAVPEAPFEAAAAAPPSKPEPFVDAGPQTGTADRAMLRPRRITAVAAPIAPAPAPTPRPHQGLFTHMKHGFARLWPLHHNENDGGQR
jgi:hypothetical protein